MICEALPKVQDAGFQGRITSSISIHSLRRLDMKPFIFCPDIISLAGIVPCRSLRA
ncbi:MAG: hypothetical protein AAFP79_17205 [Pseudomonadota bacterium]